MVGCPCGSGHEYAVCCKPLHAGKAAATAEALMRSRYVAFVRRDGAYLHRTWSQATRPPKAALMQLEKTQWTRLEVTKIESGQSEDDEGFVAFSAYFMNEDGQEQCMTERSMFRREKGRWVYVQAV